MERESRIDLLLFKINVLENGNTNYKKSSSDIHPSAENTDNQIKNHKKQGKDLKVKENQENGNENPNKFEKSKITTASAPGKNVIIGICATNASGITAANQEMTFLHICNLNLTVSGEMLKEHIESSLGTTEAKIIIEKLKTSGLYNSFKVGVSNACVEKVMSPEFWPEGVKVRPFQSQFRNKFRQQKSNKTRNYHQQK